MRALDPLLDADWAGALRTYENRYMQALYDDRGQDAHDALQSALVAERMLTLQRLNHMAEAA